MCKLLAYLLVGIPESNIVFFSNDEIVIDDSDNKFLPFVESCVEKYNLSTNIKTKVKRFLLMNIGENTGYIKLYEDANYELKCVDSDYVHMLIRIIEVEKFKAMIYISIINIHYQGLTMCQETLENLQY